jgi:hypothetical protein
MKTNSIEKNSIVDEFQNVPINDQRLINRLVITAIRFDEGPEKSIPDACRNWAETSAAYDFFTNEKVTPDAILSSHRLNTIERLKKYPLVLLIQDTTKFDFSTHKSTKGLAPYTKDPYSLGLLMHSVLAVSPNGVPLGLLYQEIWSRENYPDQKRYMRAELPIEAKESFKWLKALDSSLKDIPNTVQTVTIGDREADIFELFQKAHQRGAHLVIRARHNRRITGEYNLLYDQVKNIPEMGQCLVDIPRKPEQNLPPRQAKLSVRFCPVNICPAHSRSKNPPGSTPLYVIFAQEIDVPEGEEPIEWLLLTTIPVTNMTEAIQKIEWYRERWKIERFHYTLKSGCNVEELQLETKERLSNAIALYSVIAWRLTWLTYQARVTPDLSCQIILETHEWQALYCVVNQTKTLPDQPPTLHEAIRLIAKLGGFLGRKHDGEPGVKVLWRGLQKLNEGLLFVEYFRSIPSPSHDVGNV